MIKDVGPPCRNPIYTWIIYKDKANLFKVEIFPEFASWTARWKSWTLQNRRNPTRPRRKNWKKWRRRADFHELFGLRNDAFDFCDTGVFFFGGGFVREIKFMEVHLHSVMGWFIGFKDSRSYQWESCLVDLDFRFVDLGLEGVGGSKSWFKRGAENDVFFFYLLVLYISKGLCKYCSWGFWRQCAYFGVPSCLPSLTFWLYSVGCCILKDRPYFMIAIQQSSQAAQINDRCFKTCDAYQVGPLEF